MADEVIQGTRAGVRGAGALRVWAQVPILESTLVPILESCKGDEAMHAHVQACKAQALYMCGEPYKHAAALLVSEVLHKEPEHEGALLEYVRIVLDRGLFADAMRILLRLLVHSHEKTAVRQACNVLLQLIPFSYESTLIAHSSIQHLNNCHHRMLKACALPSWTFVAMKRGSPALLKDSTSTAAVPAGPFLV